MTPNTPMTELPVELEPCPFCGATAKMVERHNPMSKWRYSVDCAATTCGMSGPVEASAHDAIAAWNRRASQSLRAPAGEVDGVTDEMLNAGQERLCEIRSITHFDDDAQAEIYKAMRAVDPLYASPPSEGVKVKAALDTLRLLDDEISRVATKPDPVVRHNLITWATQLREILSAPEPTP